MYSSPGYQIKMIDNNWLDDVDSLAENSSSLALSVIKSKSHPKLIPSFLGHDSLSKIISNIYHWMTQGIHSWPGRISLHTPTLPSLTIGPGILKMCLTVRVTWYQTLTQECLRGVSQNMFSQGTFLNKLKCGMFSISNHWFQNFSPSAVLIILIVLFIRKWTRIYFCAWL